VAIITSEGTNIVVKYSRDGKEQFAQATPIQTENQMV